MLAHSLPVDHLTGSEYLFNCLCIEGIAECASLLVLARVTSYFSWFLVSTQVSLKGNISLTLVFLVHLRANFRLS